MIEKVEILNEYVPSKKGVIFHSSPARYKVAVGGYGSGKTRMAVEEVVQLILENPGMEFVVMRKTMPALRDTTMQEFLNIVPYEAGVMNRKTDNFSVVNGSKVMFRGLDEPSKFKSLNVAGILFDEADEFDYEDFQVMNSRLRQTGMPLHFILVLNPVDETHWIYKTVVDNGQALEDNGGLLELHLSTYDNAHNLPPGYIEQLMATMTPDEQNRYIHGNWGRIQRGLAIFGDLFNHELHVRRWDYNAGMEIRRGWDFGVKHPACVITLKDHLGRKNIYHEILGEDEILDVFAPRVIQTCNRLFGTGSQYTDFCDPRGHDRSDKGFSSVEILNDHGIYPIGERGIRAYVEPGIRCIRAELSQLVQGRPKLTVSPDCPIMITAFSGAYVYDDKGQVKKDGYYDHLMDGYRYDSYQDKSNDSVKLAMKSRTTRRKVRNAITGY